MSSDSAASEPLALEKNLRYKFKDTGILAQALSHRSVGSPNNERLEYLGDSILGYVIAEFLYHRFPELPEGDLTKMRAALVCQKTLSSLARELDFQAHLIMGSGEVKSGGCNRDSILSDAFEAVVGALYLDGGMSAVKHVLEKLYQELLETIKPAELKDSKTLLQEVLQKQELPLPVYQVIEQSGQAHRLTFTVSCTVPGIESAFIATGNSRKKAEQSAAALAVEALNQ
ncbi:ribonuclease III [Candidatus Spongiihabitans sp.]|uniref:ribonuclease III n=1 Tax=Candidatus Spongiihabitans sp. TaxID=3101308 RepID=UPI003C7A111D